MHNYLYELKQLGQSYKSIGQALGLPTSRVSAIAHGDARLPVSVYEKTRTLHRTTLSQALQKEGITGAYRKSYERANFTKVKDAIGSFNNAIDSTHKIWNREYLSYKRDPVDWKKRHQYSYYKGKNDKRAKWHYPKKHSKAEIRDTINKSKNRVMDIENEDTTGWDRYIVETYGL